MLSLVLGSLAAHAAPANDAITVSGAWVRASVADTTAVYLELTNSDSVAHSLVGASSPAASTVELHTTSSAGGVQQMRPVSSFRVNAGSSLSLSAGGRHLMLIGLDGPLTSGSVSVTLEYDDGTEETVRASVRR